jgi:hypothetical protein
MPCASGGLLGLLAPSLLILFLFNKMGMGSLKEKRQMRRIVVQVAQLQVCLGGQKGLDW